MTETRTDNQIAADVALALVGYRRWEQWKKNAFYMETYRRYYEAFWDWRKDPTEQKERRYKQLWSIMNALDHLTENEL